MVIDKGNQNSPLTERRRLKHGAYSKYLVIPGDSQVRRLVGEFMKLSPHLREEHRPMLELLSAEILVCRRLYAYLRDVMLTADAYNAAVGNWRGLSNSISRNLRELKLTPASLTEAEDKALGRKRRPSIVEEYGDKSIYEEDE